MSAFRSAIPSDICNVDGLVAVVTGGGSGIGLIMATALENNGATVYIIGRRMHLLEKAATENNKFNKIIPVQGDLTDRDSLLSVVEIVRSKQGHIDLLVNNAGIAKNLYSHPLPSPSENEADRPPTPPQTEVSSPPASPTASIHIPSIKKFQSSLWDTGSPDDFAQVFATNVTAPYYTTVAFLDLLHQGNIRKQIQARTHGDTSDFSRPPYHSSQVLTVSSSGAFRLDAKVLSMSYTLSKSACNHLGKVMANLLVPWGIRSNIIAPGVWPSGEEHPQEYMTAYSISNFGVAEMTASAVADSSSRLDPDLLCQDVPLKRAGTEEDMAGAILFLASRAGAYMNGSVFVADGGRSNAYLGGGASSYI
ncbi:NAD(P)-binding protein [Hymenopellis radicata]|nr:NAD(P)-binding protein [Hymenopellis radicata]